MDKKTMAAIIKRMDDALEAMDASAESEQAEEICAEIEDTVFFLKNLDADDADDAEEIGDTLEQIMETLDSIEEDGAFGEKAEVLKHIVAMAIAN